MSLIYKNNISRNLLQEELVLGSHLIDKLMSLGEKSFVLLIVPLEINLILLNGLAILILNY